MSEPWFDLYRQSIPADLIGLIPASVAHECSAIAVAQRPDGTLVLAVADPGDIHNLDKLRFFLNRQFSLVQATPQAVKFALMKYYPGE